MHKAQQDLLAELWPKRKRAGPRLSKTLEACLHHRAETEFRRAPAYRRSLSSTDQSKA
jgi:hypothetical protein